MFTGLVQAVGRVRERIANEQGARLSLAVAWPDLEQGESINVDGACLTVVEHDSDGFQVDLSQETLQRTTLGSLGAPSEVNLERALRASDRLGGHWVTGHVDEVVRVTAISDARPGLRAQIALSGSLIYLVAEKGSVSLNGVSLTVNAVDSSGFEVLLIPHTLAVTNLRNVAVGSSLNFEADLMARYAARWLNAPAAIRALEAPLRYNKA